MNRVKQALLVTAVSGAAAVITVTIILLAVGPPPDRPGVPTPPAAPRGLPAPDPAALALAFNSPDPAARNAAARALALIGPPALSCLERTLPAAPDIDARMDAVTLLAQIGGPGVLPALVKTLENVPEDDPRQRAALRNAAADLMTGLGNAYPDAFAAAVIESDCSIFAREAAADACVRIGRPAVGHISGYIIKRNTFPQPEVLKLWVRTLGSIGDPGANLALEHAASAHVDGIGEIVAEARRNIRSVTREKNSSPEPDR